MLYYYYILIKQKKRTIICKIQQNRALWWNNLLDIRAPVIAYSVSINRARGNDVYLFSRDRDRDRENKRRVDRSISYGLAYVFSLYLNRVIGRLASLDWHNSCVLLYFKNEIYLQLWCGHTEKFSVSAARNDCT